MAQLNDDAQWIVMMGFIVSIAIFFLAIIVAESALVGKTTSESVLEFPKSDIQDLRSELMTLKWDRINDSNIRSDLTLISIERKNAIILYSNSTNPIEGTPIINIYYNNGITTYNETYEEFF